MRVRSYFDFSFCNTFKAKVTVQFLFGIANLTKV